MIQEHQVVMSRVEFDQFILKMDSLEKMMHKIYRENNQEKNLTLPKLDNKWKSIKYVSDHLGIEKSTLTYWSKETVGTIQRKKIGDKVFINIEEVYNLLNVEKKEENVSLKFPKRRAKRVI